MRKTIILAITIIGIATVCGAQSQFVRVISGDNTDLAKSLIQTTDGGYAIAGYTESYGLGVPESTNILVVKLNAIADHDWSLAIGGSRGEEASTILQTNDSGYAVLGNTRSYGEGDFDMLLVKLSSAGTLEWARTIGTSSRDLAYSLVQTFDGGYALGGNSSDSGVDFLLIKLSPTGAFEWARSIGGSGSECANSVIQTSDSGYAMTGWTYSYGGFQKNVLTMKVSSAGSLEWACVIGGADYENGESIIQTIDDGYAIIGYTDGYGAGGRDLLFTKLSSNGAYEWSRTVGGTNEDEGKTLVQTTDGGYALGGHSYSYAEGAGDFFLVKISSAGAFEWARTLDAGGKMEDRCYSLIQTSDNGYAMAGYCWKTYTDFFFAKYDSSGASCSGTTATPIVSEISPDFIDTLPDVDSTTLTVSSVTPEMSNVTPTITDVCTELGILESAIAPTRVNVDISPNPFNSSCKITAPSDAEVAVYDLNGTLLMRSSNAERAKGLNRTIITWRPAAAISSGIYWVRVSVGSQCFVKRLVYLK